MTLDDTLVSLTAVELRRMIGARQLSPVELLEACIARIEAVNPYVNAVTARAYERARAEARAAERAVMAGEPLGLLHGLPMGVKDLEPTAGVLTTYGSALYRGYVPDEDVELVARLRRAAPSSPPRPTCRRWAQGPIHAIRCGARRATRSTPT